MAYKGVWPENNVKEGTFVMVTLLVVFQDA